MSSEHHVAAAHLAKVNAELWALRKRVGDPTIPQPKCSAFESLARSIVFQQLNGTAASTIWRRVANAAGSRVSPQSLAALSDEQLRACGLSAGKLRALRDLCEHAPRLKLSSLHRLTDDEIIQRLVAVRGIGVWTAHMFLMFHLRRLDVWPTTDLGVREGYRRLYRLSERPSDRELLPLGECFRPYRSVAAWYMWRAVEALPP
jgi:DNA-3-methyladenine glycosylase II